MGLKDWIQGLHRPGADVVVDIEDLIILERYEEAEQQLKAKLRNNPKDLHGQLKLAEVYVHQQEVDKAVDQYLYVADEYAQDGFYDRAIALLNKATKVMPGDVRLRKKAEILQWAKTMEHSRKLALEGMRERPKPDETLVLRVQQWWHEVAKCSVVRKLEGEQLKRFFSAVDLEEFRNGTVLAEKGSTDARLLVLVKGSIEAVLPRDDGGETGVRTYGSGDVIGEMATLENKAWPATYRAKEKTVALVLTRDRLEEALKGNPDPRGFLEALREQHSDRNLAAQLERMR